MTTATQFRGLAARLRYHHRDPEMLRFTLVRNLPTILTALDAAAETAGFTRAKHTNAIITLSDTDPDT